MNRFKEWLISLIPETWARHRLDYLFEAQRDLLHARSVTEEEMRRKIWDLEQSKRSVYERIKLLGGDIGDTIPYDDLKIDNMRLRGRIIFLDKNIADILKSNRENLALLRKGKGVVNVSPGKARRLGGLPKKNPRNKKSSEIWSLEEREAIKLARAIRKSQKSRSKRIALSKRGKSRQ